MAKTPDLEISTCPLCHSSTSAVFDERLLHDYRLTNRRCLACGMVYLSPRLSESQLVAFYARDYRTLYHGSAEPTPQDLAVQEPRARFLASVIRRQGLDPIRRHLDIGCSTGTLLQTFADEFGSSPAGVELDDSHRAYAQRRGLTVVPALDDLPKEGLKYDLVSLIHELEHLPDPVGSLVNIRRNLLNPAGWLLLEVPNLYMHDSFEIAHLVSYSRMSLIQTVQQAGYKPVLVISHGEPRSRLLRLYITLLAQPVGKEPPLPPIRPEKLVKFRRRTGLQFRRLIERFLPALAWRPV